MLEYSIFSVVVEFFLKSDSISVLIQDSEPCEELELVVASSTRKVSHGFKLNFYFTAPKKRVKTVKVKVKTIAKCRNHLSTVLVLAVLAGSTGSTSTS